MFATRCKRNIEIFYKILLEEMIDTVESDHKSHISQNIRIIEKPEVESDLIPGDPGLDVLEDLRVYDHVGIRFSDIDS